MTTTMQHPHRRGAALIIALLILAGLMLLGLPFLFSQSSSLSGARSFQAAQAARMYSETARNLGAALAAYTVNGHWITGSKQLYTAIDQYLNNTLTPVLGGVIPPTPPTNHTDIDPLSLGFNQVGTNVRVRIGLAIEDESGKLDANTLGPQGWTDLLKALGIPDWDDGVVVTPAEWTLANKGPDGDQCGELANALVHQRLHRSSYSRLEELLDVDPQTQTGHRTIPGITTRFRKCFSRAELERLRPYLSFHNVAPGRRGLIDLGTVIYTDNSSQLSGLNTSIFVPQQSWIDAQDVQINDGTWLIVEPKPNEIPITAVTRRYNSSINSWNITLKTGGEPEPGSALLIQAPPPLNVHALPKVLRELPAYKRAQKPTDALPYEIFPAVPLVSWYGQQTTITFLDPISNISGTKNALSLRYLHPTYIPMDVSSGPSPPTERQPLDIHSGGAVTIEHAATVVDPAGNPIAQESRRTIVQAVPQESILERSWATQGQLQPLIDQRYGSKMVTWPMATARNIEVQVDDIDPAVGGTPKAETGLSFATNSTLASTAPGLEPKHLNLSDSRRPAWRVNMGNGSPTTEALVFKDSQNQDPVTDGSLLPPKARYPFPDKTTDLYPDGVRLRDGSRLAYSFGGDNNGPLTWTKGIVSVSPPAIAPTPDSSMGLRTISVWFRPELDWPTSSPVTILEARPLPSTVTDMRFAGVDPADVPHTTDNTNFFGVIYDPKQNMLVLAYGTPGVSFAPATTRISLLPSIGFDLASTADVDERCLVGPNFLIPTRMNVVNCAAWSSTFIPNRILTCYKLGNKSITEPNLPEIGRWYHLQVTLANGRPGGLGLILDGIAGSDVGLMTQTDYLAARPNGPLPGDHLTLPGVVLSEPTGLPPISRTDPNPPLSGYSIKVELPGFLGLVPPMTVSPLTVADIMPPQGSVLIGDEYIRYENILVSGTSTTLVNCTRGDRQNTYTNGSDATQRNPITESHVQNSRVLVDGCRLQPEGTENLYRGGAIAADDIPIGSASNDYQVVAKITDPSTNLAISVPVNSGTLDLTVDGGFDTAPLSGYLRLNDTFNNDYYYFYTRSGTQVTIEGIAPAPFKPKFDMKIPNDLIIPAIPGARLRSNDSFFNNIGIRQATVTLVSLKCSSPYPIADTTTVPTTQWFKWPTGGLIQLSLDYIPPTTPPPVPQPVQPPYRSDQHYWSMIQVSDKSNGRCEWLRYTDIIKRGTDFYFIDREGWNFIPTNPSLRSRGLCRTKFDTVNKFTAGATILPVQTGVNKNPNETGLDGWTKLLSPGDLITLVSKQVSATRPSIVAAVRFAATDGYSGTIPLDPNYDTVNGQFACTAPLSAIAAGVNLVSEHWGDYEIVMGSGLNTQLDLSPTGSTNLPPSAPPLLATHQDPTDPTKTGRLVFGGGDTERGGTATSGLLMTIDAPMAAPPFGSTYASFLRRVIQGGACVDRIPATGGLPIIIEVDFHDNLFGGDRMGLVEIGGEVFAYRRTTSADQLQIENALNARRGTGVGKWVGIRPTPARKPAKSSTPANPDPDPEVDPQTDDNWNNFATLVGRGLLGSSQREHLMNMSIPDAGLSVGIRTNRENLDRGPEVMRLPVGPVRTLIDPLLKGSKDWFAVAVDGATGSTDDFIAPAVLICNPLGDPTGTTNEVIQLAAIDRRQKISQWNGPTGGWTNNNFQKWVTAPWLRGLYNTPSRDWISVAGGLQPIAIGWWTRYPSALPSNSSPPLSGTDAAAQLRSRAFPWVGFCSSMARSRFDDNAMPFTIDFDTSLSTNKALFDAGSLSVEFRAMVDSIDGDSTVKNTLAYTSKNSFGDWSKITAVEINSPLNGINTLSGLFPWDATTPAIHETNGIEVRVSFRYTEDPSAVLSDIARAANRAPLIGGAKLRFHAPLTVLATESAR